MRIFGGHDYYDCGLSLGIDPTVVLFRGKSKSIPVEQAGGSLLSKFLETRTYSQQFHVRSVAVAFCGKIYRGAIAGLTGQDEGFWSAARLSEQAGRVKNMEVILHEPWAERKKWTLEDYFTPTDASPALRDYMIRNKISILVEDNPDSKWGNEFKVNPFTLKQIGFAKAVDPYTAFQELSMWIGGVLGGVSPEIVTITDNKVLAENHGFDKFSFRGPRLV